MLLERSHCVLVHHLMLSHERSKRIHRHAKRMLCKWILWKWIHWMHWHVHVHWRWHFGSTAFSIEATTLNGICESVICLWKGNISGQNSRIVCHNTLRKCVEIRQLLLVMDSYQDETAMLHYDMLVSIRGHLHRVKRPALQMDHHGELSFLLFVNNCKITMHNRNRNSK